MKRMMLLACLVVIAAHAPAQGRKILSPRDSVFLSLDSNTVSVNYGRPSMRGRVIMGGLVPWDKVWRTGANEATHLKTNFDMTLGGVPVPKGTYTLWTLPSSREWKIIINKQTGQWGTNYDERQDLARFGAPSEPLPSPVDTFAITLEKTGQTSGRIVLVWEKTRVAIPFEKNDHIRPLSPTDSATTQISGMPVSVVYSRPFIRGRQIWGCVVPFDTVWRTGANSSTLMRTMVDLRFGNTLLAPGTYILRSLPTDKAFTLIVSKQPGKPGPIPDSLIVARVTMDRTTPAASIDPFRIWFEPQGKDAAQLTLGWGDRQYAVTISGKK